MSGEQPSIKGVALKSAVHDLNGVLARGDIPARTAVERLTDAERAVLSAGVDDEAWYPIDCYDRICRLLLEYDGRGQPDYFKQRGRAAAERLIVAGAFKQVDFVRRIDRESALEKIALNIRLAGTIWSSVFNFGTFRLKGGDDQYNIEIDDGEHFTDMTAESILGFMERLSEEAGPDLVTVSYGRPREELLLYRFRWRT